MNNFIISMHNLVKYPGGNIAGNKIILRQLEVGDLKKSFLWLKDPGVNKFLSQNFKELTEEQELKWFRFMQSSENDLVFAIVEKQTNTHIGNCALHKINFWKKSCELGIVIGEKTYWNQGFGTDALKSMVDFAFGSLELKSISLDVYQYNKRAIQAYNKCGFKLVKTLEKSHLYNGSYWDTLVMELLSEQK